MVRQNGEESSGIQIAILTLFNAILIRVLLVHWLSLIGSCNSLNALIEVVLDWSALFGFLAFCVPLASHSNTIVPQVSVTNSNTLVRGINTILKSSDERLTATGNDSAVLNVKEHD
jgi:membrane-anchored protein YejM (alkaline phosphatase superfamily)